METKHELFGNLFERYVTIAELNKISHNKDEIKLQ